MKRLLPPLLVLAVLATVGVRCLLEPNRSVARDLISGLTQGGDGEEASRRLREYQAAYDSLEDRWFAARMWFQLARPTAALETIWDDPELAAANGTARRFAEMGLLALGWIGEDRAEATAIEPHALLPLVEGHNAWADERLRSYARERELIGVTSYYFPAVMNASRRPMDLIVEEFRKREDHRFQTAAALGALGNHGSADYAQKASDIARLAEIIGNIEWRHQLRDVWCAASIALGRSGEAAAVAALEQAAADLEDSPNEHDRLDRQVLHAGLLASGRFDLQPELKTWIFVEAPNLNLTSWYLEALIHRYRLGDGRSELHLREMWEGPGARFKSLRHRVARAFLLQDAPPTDEAVKVFVGRMASELEAPGEPLVGRMLALAWHVRAGEDGARARLIEALREMGRAFERGGASDGDLAHGMTEALRALYLYG